MNITGIIKRHPLTTFFSITFLLTWACWVPLALFLSPEVLRDSTHASPLLLLQLLGNIVPSLVALLLTGVCGGRQAVKSLLGQLRLWRVGGRWYAAALLLVPGLTLVAIVLYRLFGGALPAYQWIAVLPTFVISFISAGLGEELGWRGFALPRLQARYAPLPASLLLGIVWGMWHLPLLIATSKPLTPLFALSFTVFVLIMTAFSVLAAWIYNHTHGSLLLTVLFHATITTTLNTFLLPLPGLAPGLLTLALLWLAVFVIATRTIRLSHNILPA